MKVATCNEVEQWKKSNDVLLDQSKWSKRPLAERLFLLFFVHKNKKRINLSLSGLDL